MFVRFIVLIVFINCYLSDVKAQEEISQPIPGQYIVKVDSEEALDNIKVKIKKYGGETNHIFKHAIMGASVNIPPGKEEEFLSDLSNSGITLFQDFTIFATSKMSELPDEDSNVKSDKTMTGGSTQIIPTGINWIDAELNTTNEGLGTTVAVLDTGIDFTHPDLNDNVDVSLSRDCTVLNSDGSCSLGGSDDNFSSKGHGTHVAGVIGAEDNATGVLGVGSRIKLVSIKVLKGSGSGSFSNIIAGLDYVTANADKIAITNSSLGARGGTNPSQGFINVSNLLREAYQRAANAGVVNVVSAGNEAVNVTSNNAVPAMYPEVITVSALSDSNGVQDSMDSWASFSNFGSEVDIIAPGVNILSTAIGGGTSSLSGTSFSSPYVAGTVALYISKNGRPASGNAQLLSSLINTISKARSPLLGEPTDGFTEPSCYSNGTGLK